VGTCGCDSMPGKRVAGAFFIFFYSEAFSMGTVGGVVAREDFGVVMEKGREKCL